MEGKKRAGRNLGSAIRHGAGPFHTTHTNTAELLALDLSTRPPHHTHTRAMGVARMALGPEQTRNKQGIGNKELGIRVHIRGKSRRDVVVRIFFFSSCRTGVGQEEE